MTESTIAHEGPLTSTVRDLYAAFQRGDVAAIVARCADDVVWDHHALASAECPWNGNFSGRANVPGFFAALANSLEFRTFEPYAWVESGRQVAVTLRLESVVRKNGRTLANDGVHLWTFDSNGKVARYQHFNDTAAELHAWRD